MSTSKSKALKKKTGHGLTIEPHTVPGAKKGESHHKIKEWGYVFPSKNDAEKYASSHKLGPQGNIIKN